MIGSTNTSTATHIPRPPNKWILFRCDFMARGGSPAEAVEVWNAYTAEEKAPWQRRARLLAKEHARRYPKYKYKPKKKQYTSDGDSFLHYEPTPPVHGAPSSGTRERGRTGSTSRTAVYARPQMCPRASTESSSSSSSPSPYVPNLSVGPRRPLPSSISSAESNWMHYGAHTQTPSGSFANYGAAGHPQMSGAYPNAAFDLVSESYGTSTNMHNPFTDFGYRSSGYTQLNVEPLCSTGLHPSLDNGYYPPFQMNFGYGPQPSSSYGGTFNNFFGSNTTTTPAPLHDTSPSDWRYASSA